MRSLRIFFLLIFFLKLFSGSLNWPVTSGRHLGFAVRILHTFSVFGSHTETVCSWLGL